jgi:flagellar hook-associated protein 3 FlgL
MKTLADALQGGSSDPQGAARSALDSLSAGLDAVTTGQTVIGARLAWIDLTTERRTNLGELRAGEESDVGGTDLASTVAKLQEMMTVLEASQASFGKLAGLSLFDRIT